MIHSYSIVGVYDFNNIKLIKLRNPWGKIEWKGRWCDTDPNWTIEM